MIRRGGPDALTLALVIWTRTLFNDLRSLVNRVIALEARPVSAPATPEIIVWTTDMPGALDGTFWAAPREGANGGPTTVWTCQKAGTYKWRAISAYAAKAQATSARIDGYKIAAASSDWGTAVGVGSAVCADGSQTYESATFTAAVGETYAFASIADIGSGINLLRIEIIKVG